MAYKFKPNTGYWMPTNFGPGRSQDFGHYEDTTGYAVRFLTDKDALAALLPEPLEPADKPLVTVSCQVFKGVDFMAGGGYNLLQVNLAAVFVGKKDHVAGDYAAVLWENEMFPVLLGRELLGAPKLLAQIPDPWMVDGIWRWYCSESGARLIEGEMRNMRELDGKACQEMQERGRQGHWLCWKYIPRADFSGADCSFPTDVRNRPTVKQAWVGEGRVDFHETVWEKTPVAAQIMAGLRTLKIKEYQPAVIQKGSNDLLVAQTRRLE